MTPKQYQHFSQQLQKSCAEDDRIIGLVAVGSMAQQDYQPDRWSDHDFFVICKQGKQNGLKQSLSWLPNNHQIAYSLHDSQHGMKVLFANYHLVEFAVFDREELKLAKANRYRVLVDKGDVMAQMAAIAADTAAFAERSFNPEQAMGHFLGNLWVGYGRYQRGEHLSAHEFVKTHALVNLIKLIQVAVPSDDKGVLDNLNPLRRFERAYPQIGVAINSALAAPTPDTCRQLLHVAKTELATRLPDFPEPAFALLEAYFVEGDGVIG